MEKLQKYLQKKIVTLILIFALGLIIRVFLSANNTIICMDGVCYARLGKNLIETGKYVFGENYNYGIIFPPGYPILIGLINLTIDDLFVSGKIISLISSLLTILIFYLLGKELGNTQSGLFAAFCYSIYPGINLTAAKVQSESICFLLFFMSIYFFISWSKNKHNFRIILYSIFASFSFLVRPEGIFLLILPFIFFREIIKKRMNIIMFILAFIIFIGIASPYLIFINKSSETFTFAGKTGFNLLKGETFIGVDCDKEYYSLNKRKNQIKILDMNLNTSVQSYIIGKPFKFIKKYIYNLIKEISLVIYLLLPFLVPLVFIFFDKNLFKNKINMIFILLSLIFFAMFPVFFITERFVYVIILLLICISSIGYIYAPKIFSMLLAFYNIQKNKVISFVEDNIKMLVIVLIITYSLANIIYFLIIQEKIKPPDYKPVEQVRAGKFLRQYSLEGYEKINVMYRTALVSYYCDAKYTFLPYSDYEDIIDFAKLYNVDFIVIDERMLKKWEYYDNLMRLSEYSEDVELIYTDKLGKLIKIFKLSY